MAGGKIAKDGLTAVAGALRKAFQDLIVPELKHHAELLGEHGSLLREHAQALNAILSVLHEHSQILRQHGERLARVEGELVGLRESIRDGFESVRNEIAGVRSELSTVRVEGAGAKRDLKEEIVRLGDKLDVRERLAAVESRVTALETRDQH